MDYWLSSNISWKWLAIDCSMRAHSSEKPFWFITKLSRNEIRKVDQHIHSTKNFSFRLPVWSRIFIDSSMAFYSFRSPNRWLFSRLQCCNWHAWVWYVQINFREITFYLRSFLLSSAHTRIFCIHDENCIFVFHIFPNVRLLLPRKWSHVRGKKQKTVAASTLNSIFILGLFYFQSMELPTSAFLNEFRLFDRPTSTSFMFMLHNLQNATISIKAVGVLTFSLTFQTLLAVNWITFYIFLSWTISCPTMSNSALCRFWKHHTRTLCSWRQWPMSNDPYGLCAKWFNRC